MQYFDLFGLTPSLKTDKEQVRQIYYTLSRQWHPDRFVRKGQAAQEEAQQMTALIHAAREVLEDPMRRLAYILKEKGLIGETDQYKPDPVFLMEVMDWHEQYQDGDEAVQARALTAMRQMETSLDKGVAAYFNQDTLLLDSEALQILREYYYRRKYLDRMRSHS